jgi:hypothetical protein
VTDRWRKWRIGRLFPIIGPTRARAREDYSEKAPLCATCATPSAGKPQLPSAPCLLAGPAPQQDRERSARWRIMGKPSREI